ncbi:hypothetical protein [Turneriella parva]|uniref:Uncharacterized protein n=1 Tax=Turneriella parva (strain ATCC BAA-1111 / DSM 21527 / NCTC 11395 / H) TaxID=869212 RepID=I4B215_TURPD|nr:hypothetical protein [Turneriella parva]AFM11322.1 hypothetical protein Turpa_0670 [Turneriella parva DSM 21527]
MPSARLTDTEALIAEFKSYETHELENLFSNTDASLRLEPGSYRGTWLKRIEHSGSYKPFNLVSQWLLFEVTPFGITFHADGTGIWYFFHPTFAAGEFRLTEEKSQWRNTDALTLRYDQASLPGFVRALLYDEIKPLSNLHAIGIGGFNEPTGEGDNFFFLLTPA